MKNVPVRSVPPLGSKARLLVSGSHFHDSWAVEAAEPRLDPLGQFLRVAKSAPRWIDLSMRLRNRVVRWCGLKDLGDLSAIDASKTAAQYRPGDRVGIFTLISASHTEVLLGDRDKHLDVVVSVHMQRDKDGRGVTINVTTIVKVHNWLGWLYMLPVRPAHHVIVLAMIRMIGSRYAD